MASPAEPDDSNLGRVVADRFRIDAVLGAGSLGMVYRATHLQLQRAVALKTLRPSVAAEPSSVARFSREAQLAGKLDHPNVVQVFDHGTEPDGLTYIVMELLAGRDLARVMHDEALSTERIVQIMAQVLSAAAAAHRLGIVHRDLKPENIMLVERLSADGEPVETVKVADFGLAKSYGTSASQEENITVFGTVSGTPEYMSPEQANGDELDHRSDVYACGAILYEMLAGAPPFEADTTMRVLEMQIREPVVPPSKRRAGVDARLEGVVLRALAKAPDARFPDAGAMRAALLGTAVADDAPTLSLDATSVDSREVAAAIAAERRAGPPSAIATELLGTAPTVLAPSKRARASWRGARMAGVIAAVVLVAGGVAIVAARRAGAPRVHGVTAREAADSERARANGAGAGAGEGDAGRRGDASAVRGRRPVRPVGRRPPPSAARGGQR